MTAFVGSGISFWVGKTRLERENGHKRCRVGVKMTMAAWMPTSWREKVGEGLGEGLDEIARLPSLIYAGEVDRLKGHLAKAEKGTAFLLQAGDREEDFAETHGENTESTFRLLVAQVIILAYTSGLPVIKVGHHSGHYEKVGPFSVPSKEESKEVTRSYYQQSSTLNLLRAVAKSPSSMLEWTAFINKVAGDSCKEFIEKVEDALCFVAAAGLDVTNEDFREPEFYCSHEMFLLPYEQALSRKMDGVWYGTSSHMFWVELGSKRLSNAHVEYLRGVANPVSIRVNAETSTNELVALIRTLNPDNESGRIAITTSFGAAQIWSRLPATIHAIRDAGINCVWACDPMRGNSIATENECLTCPVDLLLSELGAFFAIHVQEGTVPGGVYLDMTGDDVSECVGGVTGAVREADVCCEAGPNSSPRLNSKQGLDVAFELGRRLRAVKAPGQRLRDV